MRVVDEAQDRSRLCRLGEHGQGCQPDQERLHPLAFLLPERHAKRTRLRDGKPVEKREQWEEELMKTRESQR